LIKKDAKSAKSLEDFETKGTFNTFEQNLDTKTESAQVKSTQALPKFDLIKGKLDDTKAKETEKAESVKSLIDPTFKPLIIDPTFKPNTGRPNTDGKGLTTNEGGKPTNGGDSVSTGAGWGRVKPIDGTTPITTGGVKPLKGGDSVSTDGTWGRVRLISNLLGETALEQDEVGVPDVATMSLEDLLKQVFGGMAF
jgi:hypothetical protein